MRTIIGIVSFGETFCGNGPNPRYFIIAFQFLSLVFFQGVTLICKKYMIFYDQRFFKDIT